MTGPVECWHFHLLTFSVGRVGKYSSLEYHFFPHAGPGFKLFVGMACKDGSPLRSPKSLKDQKGQDRGNSRSHPIGRSVLYFSEAWVNQSARCPFATAITTLRGGPRERDRQRDRERERGVTVFLLLFPNHERVRSGRCMSCDLDGRCCDAMVDGKVASHKNGFLFPSLPSFLPSLLPF